MIIVKRTTGTADAVLSKVADAEAVLGMRKLVREVPIADNVLDFALSVVVATHPGGVGAPRTNGADVTCRYGCESARRPGPRHHGQSLRPLRRSLQCRQGRCHQSGQNRRFDTASGLNFEAEADGINTDGLIDTVYPRGSNPATGTRSPFSGSVARCPATRKLLDNRRLNPRRTFSGHVQGERLTSRRGISIEFADYREYVEGDDLRHLDWNVLARLDNAVVKSYRDEEDLAVHLLVDASPSMNFGSPTKLFAAKRLAAALGSIALAGGDAVYVRTLGKREQPQPPMRGRPGFTRLMRAVDAVAPGKGGRLAPALLEFAKTETRRGIAILLSDGFDPSASGALRALGGRGFEVLFLQVVADEDLEPPLEGDLRLIDDEGGEPVEITANSTVLREYEQRLGAHNAALQQAVLRAGGRYALVRARTPLETLISNVWRRDGWLA